MSNKGYGALRNTYAPGEYDFQQTVSLSHTEARFDCFYFVGNTLQDILGSYTDITGKPFLMPRWALSMGDANCYNRGAKPSSSNSTGTKGTTPDVIKLIADNYIKHNMPRGWILPNDGYGCGYTKLDSVVKELHKRGFYTGLWTESGVEKIAREVGDYGTRLCKLDVAWVGPGYKFAIDGVKSAYEGIENNSDGRGFVWSVCGWAGSHRHSVLWTGDQSGSWNYIRWHIPTLIGSGLSAQNCATGDVDGIFGGSDSTYVRDLQWKCFTPVFMTMSGWASNKKYNTPDKQPWLFGEPYTSINRKYLMLKQRFTPYMYTLCNEAYETGVPSVRGMLLEFPKDTLTWGEERTKYQYMLGKSLLVAPVYKSEGKRDGIYFPEGKWFDYWSGETIAGGKTLNNYPAPLDKLPLFVRGGAILPLYPQMMFDAERAADTLTLDVYPAGQSNFTLYEDDGLTREHRKGAFAKQLFECTGESDGLQPILFTINPSNGDYKGKLQERVYLLQIHVAKKPHRLLINTESVKSCKSKEKFDIASEGWYFDQTDRKGVVTIRTKKVPVANKINFTLTF
jgi:alpha-glucosidase (family GH31 glycosyl hydrolase)